MAGKFNLGQIRVMVILVTGVRRNKSFVDN